MDSTDPPDTDSHTASSPLRKRTIQRLLELNQDYGKGLNENRVLGLSELDKDLSLSHTFSGLHSFNENSISQMKSAQLATEIRAEDASLGPQHSSDRESDLHEIGSSIDSSLLRTSPRRGEEELLDPLETSVDSTITAVRVSPGGRVDSHNLEKLTSEPRTVITASVSRKHTEDPSGKRIGRVSTTVEPRLFLSEGDDLVSRVSCSGQRQDHACQTELIYPSYSHLDVSHT